MSQKSKIKITPPPKLDSKNLTLDKLQTWYSSMRNCFKHDPDHKQFLKGQKHDTWKASKSNKDRGINIVPVEDADATIRQQNVVTAETESEKIRESLDDFLHILASKAPDGMYNTITRQATSFEWVFVRIKTAFRIQSKGVDLYTATEEGFDEENDSSTDVSFMKMKDGFEDLLSTEGTMYHGEPLETDEALTPLAESIIVIQWLRSIHPLLPKHIKERHSHLFTPEKPNWADLQPDFVKQMDTLLAEVENRENQDGEEPRIRWVGTSGRGGRNRGRGRGASRGGRTGPPTPRADRSGRFCDICHAAGKPETIVTSHNMPWCKGLSNHGKKTIVSSVRLALVEEESYNDNVIDEVEDGYDDESTNPYENI